MTPKLPQRKRPNTVVLYIPTSAVLPVHENSGTVMKCWVGIQSTSSAHFHFRSLGESKHGADGRFDVLELVQRLCDQEIEAWLQGASERSNDAVVLRRVTGWGNGR